jgi:hypothetical protein
MTNKIAAFVIIAIVLLTSCDSLQKNEPTKQVNIEKTTDHNWIYGKTFTQEGIADKNPELGGLDFLRFESKEVIELKTGDIVDRVKAEFVKDTIIITSETTNSKSTFAIVNNEYLIDKFGKKWTTASDSQGKPQATNIAFVVAKNYFVNNTVKKLDNPKIETAEKFNEIFGMATTMAKDGKPTEIDFSKQYVIAVVLPETDLSTNINLISLLKNNKNEITLNYKSVVGEKQSFTTIPNFAIIVDKKENGNVTVKEIK